MANPQKENGHIDIANEIAEQLARTQLSGYESRVLWVLWRKTYGWHKKSDKISISQFSQATGIARRHIHRALQYLVSRNIITKNGNSFITKWAFQKNYNQWQPVTKIGSNFKPLPKLGQPVTKNGNKFVTKNGAHKRKERNNTKESKVIFNYWKEILNHPRAILDKKRIKLIGARLKEGHTVSDCKEAIDGCKASPHHMGENDRHTVYDSIELIFKSAGDLERFIGYQETNNKRKGGAIL